MQRMRIELKWGLILSLSFLAWMAMERAAGWHGPRIGMQPLLTNLFLIPTAIICFLGIREKRRDYFHGQMELMQGFVTGMGITLFAAAMSPLSIWLVNQYLSPEFTPNMIDYVVGSGRMDQGSALEFFSLKNQIIQQLLSLPVTGFLLSGIVAFLLKTK